MRLTPEDYSHLITDQYGFKLECMSWVQETNHVFTCTEDFHLRTPDLNVQVFKTKRVLKMNLALPL